MAKMTDSQLLAIVNDAKDDSIHMQGNYIADNERFLKTYLGEPYGDEQEGQSQVVSVDVQDVIESDMPSLVRVFLSSHDIMNFRPTSDADAREAEEKTKYINWIINNQKDVCSFKILHDWMKDALIQKTGVVKLEYVEEEQKKTLEVDGLDDIEVTQIITGFEDDPTIEFDIKGQDKDKTGTFLEIEYTQQNKYFRIRNIPSESFLMSRNAISKEEAELVGDRTFMSRGELIAQGYEEDLIRSLPARESEENSALPQIRFNREGGEDEENINHWASEEVEVFDLYVLVDYDGDGIPERRRIILAGDRILDNDPFEIVPFAMMSAVSMPHNAIGRSRAELTQQTQRVKTVVFRQMLDNIYRVNGGRVVVNDELTNMDDLLVQRPNGIIRTKSDPRSAVAQLETPYIGQQALQVLQYVDSTRAQSTGQYVTNQALDNDQLHKETATRFEGIREAGAAKVELIARVFAETGYRELFEGLAWLVSNYQQSKTEIRVLGKQLSIDPRRWTRTHYAESNVGLAAGDNEESLRNLTGFYQIQNQLRQEGSLLVDEKTRFNTLERMAQSMEVRGFDSLFNDPEKPEKLLLAQNEQLMQMVEQLQAQAQENPFTEAERVKAQASLITAQGKADVDIEKLKLDLKKHIDQIMFDYDKLEAEQNIDIPTKGTSR